jgi:hypothetical protein
MLRKAGAVIWGLFAWVVVSSIGDRLLRLGWPAYAAAEPVMIFTLGMMGARLLIGAVSTLAGGFVAGYVCDKHRGTVLVTGAFLLLLFLPVHYSLWNKFPVWYHLVFLGSLVPLTWAGAELRRGSQS